MSSVSTTRSSHCQIHTLLSSRFKHVCLLCAVWVWVFTQCGTNLWGRIRSTVSPLKKVKIRSHISFTLNKITLTSGFSRQWKMVQPVTWLTGGLWAVMDTQHANFQPFIKHDLWLTWRPGHWWINTCIYLCSNIVQSLLRFFYYQLRKKNDLSHSDRLSLIKTS